MNSVVEMIKSLRASVLSDDKGPSAVLLPAEVCDDIIAAFTACEAGRDAAMADRIPFAEAYCAQYKEELALVCGMLADAHLSLIKSAGDRLVAHVEEAALAQAVAERDSLRAQLDAVRAAFGHGADQESWRPGETLGEAVARLVAQLDEAREVLRDVDEFARDTCDYTRDCFFCPLCGKDAVELPGTGHAPGCRLAAVLRGTVKSEEVG